METKQIPESTRKAIFAAVIDAEDSGENPRNARKLVAEKFEITTDQVKSIEQEGLDKTWPPLEDC